MKQTPPLSLQSKKDVNKPTPHTEEKKMKIEKLQKGQKPDGYLMRGHTMMTTVAYYPSLKGKPTRLVQPDMVFVGWEDARNYYGNFTTGFGFYGLRFPKKYTLELTEQEKRKYKKMAIEHSNGLIVKNFVV